MFSAQDLYDICMKIFEGVAVPTSWFVLPLFLVRVLNGQIAGDASEIRSAIKGLLLYFVLLVSFGFILDILLQIPQSFIPEVSATDIVNKTQALYKSESGAIEFLSKSIPDIVLFIVEALLALLYWAVLILHILVTIFLSALAPIIFLLACVLNVGIPVRLFFGLLIMSSCWPAMWYGFDKALPFIDKVIPNEFGKFVLELVVTLIKGIGPAALAYMSLNSGPGKAVVGATEKAAGMAGNMGLKVGKSVAGGAKFAAKSLHGKMFNSRTENSATDLSTGGGRTYAGSPLRAFSPHLSSKGLRAFNSGESFQIRSGADHQALNGTSQSTQRRNQGINSVTDFANKNSSGAIKSTSSASFKTPNLDIVSNGGVASTKLRSSQGQAGSQHSPSSAEGNHTNKYPSASRSLRSQNNSGDFLGRQQTTTSRRAITQTTSPHLTDKSVDPNTEMTVTHHKPDRRT
jgi:hypothetical protein